MRAREGFAALLLLVGCAGTGGAAQRDLDGLRAEVRALRSENEDLSRKLDALTVKVDAIASRSGIAPGAAAPPAQDPVDRTPVIPPDLAVVRVEPMPPAGGPATTSPSPPSLGGERAAERGRARIAPPVSTAVPVAAPDPERVEALSRRTARDISAEAEGELRRARRKTGIERAHALEDFAAHYPRHASADNALVESAAAYAAAGLPESACSLARRAVDEYPAGDAMSEALERLAWCESRRGARDAERALLERVVAEFPRTPAAERAGTRLATISGRTGEPPKAPRSGQ